MTDFAVPADRYTTCGVFGGIGAAHIEKAYKDGGWIAILHCIVGLIEIIPLIGWLIAFIDWCAHPPKPITQQGQNPPADAPSPANAGQRSGGPATPNPGPAATAQPASSSAPAAQAAAAPKPVARAIPQETRHAGAESFLADLRISRGSGYAQIRQNVPQDRAQFERAYTKVGLLKDAQHVLDAAVQSDRPPVLVMGLHDRQGKSLGQDMTCLLLGIRVGELTVIAFADDTVDQAELNDKNSGYLVFNKLTGALIASHRAHLLWTGPGMSDVSGEVSLEHTLDFNRLEFCLPKNMAKKVAEAMDKESHSSHPTPEAVAAATSSVASTSTPAPAPSVVDVPEASRTFEEAFEAFADSEAPEVAPVKKPLPDGLQKALEEVREQVGKVMEAPSEKFILPTTAKRIERFKKEYSEFSPWKGSPSELLSLVRASYDRHVAGNSPLPPIVVRIPFGEGQTTTNLALGVVERAEGTILVLSRRAHLEAEIEVIRRPVRWDGVTCLAYDKQGKYLGAFNRFDVAPMGIDESVFPVRAAHNEAILLKAFSEVGAWEVAQPQVPGNAPASAQPAVAAPAPAAAASASAAPAPAKEPK